MAFGKLSYLLLLQLMSFKKPANIPFEGSNSILTAVNEDLQLQESLSQLLKQIDNEKGFKNVLLYKQAQTQSCPFEDLLETFAKPRIISWQPIKNYKLSFSTDVLVLSCEEAEFKKKTFNGFLKNLRHVIFLPYEATKQLSIKQRLVDEHCQLAFQSGVYEVIILFPDFKSTLRYFRCYLYPAGPTQFNAERSFALNNNISSVPIFEQQFRNMHGAIIWSQPDLMPPRSMAYNDSEGNMQLSGYVVELVKLFASRHNATLRYRYTINVNNIIDNRIMENITRNGTVDIASSLTITMSMQTLEEISYTYDVLKYCIMIPLPKPIKHRDVFVHILSPAFIAVMALYLLIYSALLLHSDGRFSFGRAICNLEVVRAMLAQSFMTVHQARTTNKFIIFQISYTCTLVCSMYLAYLNSFLTEPPSEPLIHTFPEAKRAGIKFLFPSIEMHLWAELRTLYEAQINAIIKVKNDYFTYNRIRTSMDMRYIFPVSDRRWDIFQEHQKLFARRMFYFSEEFCVSGILVLGFPIRSDLPYRDLFDEFILRTQAVGIVNRWTSLHFSEMVRLKLIPFKDLSTSLFRSDEKLWLEDFLWIWTAFIGLMFFSIIVFVGEMIVKFSAIV